MKSGKPRAVLNPYDWLPGYGESSVAIRSEKGAGWIIEITYDDEAQENLWKRELRFNGVCSFYYADFPGPQNLDVQCEPGDDLGLLVEYPDSEAAVKWRQHFERGTPIKHYAMLFLGENLMIQVFAEGVTLSKPILIKNL